MVTSSNSHVEIADYESQAREFPANSQEFLAAGNLHQASEKSWGAAAHMAKAVAVAQGWEYSTHADFSEVMYQASQSANNHRVRQIRSVANELHHNYYGRKRHLNASAIGYDLEEVAELLELLRPLTGLAR